MGVEAGTGAPLTAAGPVIAPEPAPVAAPEPVVASEPEPVAAPSPVEEDAYAEALRRFSGDLRLMEQVVDSMHQRGVELGASHLGLLLDAYLEARDLARAEDALARLEALGVTIAPERRYGLVLASARAGRSAAALAILDRLDADRVTPGAEHAPSVLGLLLDAGRFPAARSLVRRMAARGVRALPADYQRLLVDCLRRRAVNDTFVVVDAMLGAGVLPDARLAGELVTALARSGHGPRADELVDRFAGAGVRLPATAVERLAAAHAAAGDGARAEALLAASGGALTSHHRNLLLSARIAAGELDAAWAEALALADHGQVPTGANLDRLIEVSLAARRRDLAVGALDWMLVLGIPVAPPRAAAVLLALLTGGELDRAVELVRALVERGLTVERRVAQSLVDRTVKAQRLDEARAWLARFRADGTLRQGRTHSTLVAALVAAKRLDDALALVEEMLADRVAPTPVDAARLVDGRVRARDLAAADRLLAALADHGVVLEERVYRDLMWAHARKGDAAATEAVHQRMLAAGIPSDERHQKALEWASGRTRRRLDEPAEGAEPSTPEVAEPATLEVAEPEAAQAPEVDAVAAVAAAEVLDEESSDA